MPTGFYSDPMKDPGGYLTEEQFGHLVSFASNLRDIMLLKFLFYTGRRVSEVVRCLTPADFDFRNNTVLFTILKKKTPKKMRLNVDENIMAEMNKYINSLEISEDEFIFPINRFRVDQIIKSIGIKAGMETVGNHKIHAHVLRHSFAVMMVKRVA
jgi:integrase